MESAKKFVETHQQKIALAIGYLLVAGLFFGLGRFSIKSDPPEITIDEPTIDLTQIHNNLNGLASQSQGADSHIAGAATDDLNCEGKIKGNISSSSKIYHMPGGAFYKRTVPEMCFATEAEAKAAGLRKSQR